MPFVVSQVIPQESTYQLTWEQINSGISINKTLIGARRTNSTITRWVSDEKEAPLDLKTIKYIEEKLSAYISHYSDIFEKIDNIKDMYIEFHIPKRSGGYRKIDAPNERLKDAQGDFVRILNMFMPDNHHASAFAYIKGRDCVDMVRAHQANKSKWILHLDFSNFFGSITYDYAIEMLNKIYPFSAIFKNEELSALLKTALKIGFLNNVLPQGSSISPMFTNILMIPFDHHLKNKIAEKNHMVYTRYADDMVFSSQYQFDWKKVQDDVIEVIRKAGAPLELNTDKTHYGSTSGRSYICGILLNKDNELSLGRKRQRQIKSASFNFMKDLSNQKIWDIENAQKLNGDFAWLRNVNKPYADEMVSKLNSSFKSDFLDRLHKVCAGKPVRI